MLLVDGNWLPLSIDVDIANLVEIKLIDQAILLYLPERLIYDRAADSNPLRERLAGRGIELICPHCQGRVRPPSQDGRTLRRHRHRWVVERTISWLQSFRRFVTRYEYCVFHFPQLCQARLHHDRAKMVLNLSLE